MKTISFNVYSFNELSEKAKQVAIENIRQSYYEDNDFAEWAVDDCCLFEPLQEELQNMFGENYDFPLIKNTRGIIFFSTDRDWFLDCEDAMKITNDKQFLLWLGIDNTLEGLEDISFNIYTPSGRNSDTSIEFEDFDSKFEDLIESAENKFDDHVQDILRRIQSDIEYRYTDEAIMEDISNDDTKFLENGEVYN